MAMNTRSGAPPAAPADPAVASKATRTTRARKASRARPKPRKTNASNRVHKRAPTNRKARGYVYVDENPHSIDDTSRTASPDFIPGTPPPSRRVIPETPPLSSQADMEEELAYLRRKLHRHRRQTSRHRHRGDKDDSEDESSDSEAGDGHRVSFLHHAGNKPFLSIHEQYPAVNIKYFKQIYWGTFQPRKSMRLAYDALAWSTTPKGKKDKDDATPESTNMVQLLRCFEVYAHAICFFAARPHV